MRRGVAMGGTKQGNTRAGTRASEPYLQKLLVLVLLLPPHRVEHAEARAAVVGVAVQTGGLGGGAHTHHAHRGVLEETEPLRGGRKGGERVGWGAHVASTRGWTGAWILAGERPE